MDGAWRMIEFSGRHPEWKIIRYFDESRQRKIGEIEVDEIDHRVTLIVELIAAGMANLLPGQLARGEKRVRPGIIWYRLRKPWGSGSDRVGRT
jgi:hypothetical protein